MAAQECDCDFISSGQSVISAKLIKEIQDKFVNEPTEKRYNSGMWIWKQPEQDRKYLMAADVARGDGSDHSAFHVIDLETLEQVAEFKGKVDTTRFANILMSVATEYNDALLVVEIRKRQLKINSIRTVDELYVFIFNNGRPEALKGYNDDLVMSLAIGVWIRDTALRLHEENMNMTRDAMSKIGASSPVYVPENEDDFGWTMAVGDTKESLTWLIGKK
jgi:hypothetical protein